MKFVTKEEAVAILRGYVSAFVSFRTATECSKFNKSVRKDVEDAKSYPKFVTKFGYEPEEVTKFSSFTSLVGTAVDYGMLVQNRTNKESLANGVVAPTFVPKPRTWGERVDGVLVTHKGGLYITHHFVANNKPKSEYADPSGKEIFPKEGDFALYLKPKSTTISRQTCADEIETRDFKVESIISFSVGGETYTLK
jgi:hypothetical protein